MSDPQSKEERSAAINAMAADIAKALEPLGLTVKLVAPADVGFAVTILARTKFKP